MQLEIYGAYTRNSYWDGRAYPEKPEPGENGSVVFRHEAQRTFKLKSLETSGHRLIRLTVGALIVWEEKRGIVLLDFPVVAHPGLVVSVEVKPQEGNDANIGLFCEPIK